MRFNHYNLGYRQAGEVVEVNLSGNAANVRLLDSANFSSYKRGRRHPFPVGAAPFAAADRVAPRATAATTIG